MPLSSGASVFPFTVLVKPAGADCNLACRYCFYLDKASLYPDSPRRMSEAVLEAYLRQLFASQPSGEILVSWQGGEPTLMGLDFYERSVELVEQYRRPAQRVSYSFQTNGILLDEAWCAFFKAHHFLIGLSLDGPAGMHDAYRVDRGGHGSFARVRHAWDLLQENQVETNILCAIHAANANQPLEVYRFFRDELQASFLQFIPIVEPLPPDSSGRVRVSPRSVRPEQFSSFLVKIFDEWVRHDVGAVFVQAFDSALAAWCGLPASVCVFQEVCGSALILEHNGDLYACDHFVEPAHRLGNILESPLADLAASPRQRRFGLDKRDHLPLPCRTCDVLFACRGECPRNRFLRLSVEEAPLNYLCKGYKHFFHHIDASMRRMAELLRLGRPAMEIMRN